ncbi:MAG: NERD domain-containing protein [Alphaproteobacteria bacterium]|nr:NERD domain-containing protein [Alphaproteobacteria bacterium]
MAGDRAARIGDAGERLVAYELASLEWPALHNVILAERGRTIEIDHLVRAPDGIVVLETKTCAGLIDAKPGSPNWTQRARSGRCTGSFLNPARQNLGHVRAIERFVADPAVSVLGYVVSAGRDGSPMRSRPWLCRSPGCAASWSSGTERPRTKSGSTPRGSVWNVRRHGVRDAKRRTSPMSVRVVGSPAKARPCRRSGGN